MEVDGGIPGVVGRGRRPARLLEALQPGPGLDQRAIDGEVLGRDQLLGLGLRKHALEERARDVARQQPLPVLGEDRGVPDRVIHAQAHEPAKEQVVIELLHELPLAADRVEELEQQRTQQLLGRDGGPAGLGVQPGELRGQLAKGLVDHRADRPQGMVGRHALLGPAVAEHRVRMPIVAAHAHLPLLAESGIPAQSVRTFSASC